MYFYNTYSFYSISPICEIGMASSRSPVIHRYNLVEGMELQVNSTGFSSDCNGKVEFQLKNCSRAWILHWGCTYHGNTNWFIPANLPPGTIYKLMALQTPFVKRGDAHIIVIELRDPKIHAIEFVLKDGMQDKWLKLNHGNFQIKLPEIDATNSLPPIPKGLVAQKAYMIWESKGRPASSPLQQKQDYDNALRELQYLLSKGMSLNELQSSVRSTNIDTTVPIEREVIKSPTPNFSFYRRRRDVGTWVQKYSSEHSRNKSLLMSPLMYAVESYVGGDSLINRQIYHVGNYEIVVSLRVVNGDYRVLVAGNTRGTTVLHWGVSKSSPKEWLAPPPEILPEKSKLLDVACQTYFSDISTAKGFFQFVDINLRQMRFVGIQFVIWSGGSWINNNGANFFLDLNQLNPNGKTKSAQVGCEAKDVIKWLLDEISSREKEAEKSLMHRFNIATELTERSKNEGDLGLIGILVWLRFMTCRHLTWNKNYNVKPREISEAQDKFTNLLQRIYLEQPNNREIVRLIMECVGRGGQGHVGQRIRDEILLLQRNNDCKGGMMEEWHQKLHNNSSPDDVIICEALINYVRCDFKLDVYWQTLKAKGLTRDILASYDRPILSEPRFRTTTKEGLIRDLTAYLKTLKAVHSGGDLESSIDTCLEFSKGHEFIGAAGGLPQKLLEYLHYIKAHIGDKSIGLLMEKLLDSRIDLRGLLLTPSGRLKDLLFLDLALDSSVRTTMERKYKDINFANLPEIMFYASMVLENFCLSTVNNEDIINCTKDWYRICESYKPNDANWALQAKAVLDRVQLVLADRSLRYQKLIQPSVQYLGSLLSVKKWAIDIFTEELIRAGSAGTLSILVNRLNPILRKVANLGCWQVISPEEVCGFVVTTNELVNIQNKVYKRPTVIIANKVSGEEEIPDGVVAVLTSDTPDVLSHISIRARNSKVLFASCFDQNTFKDLKSKEGKSLQIRLKSGNLIITDVISSGLSFKSLFSSSASLGVSFKKKSFKGKYAIPFAEFNDELVGAKSCNIKFLWGKVPSWIKLPVSAALPFGVFESVLSEDMNKDLAKKIYYFNKLVDKGDLSQLQAIQQTILQLKSPPRLAFELRTKMKSTGIPWPGDETEETWNRVWQTIKRVWGSKWNERAFISCKKANINHETICMAVLVQEIISADYAFVIHTKNPLSGDSSEIYAEIVKGLGETLVGGSYPGRAMSFVTKKSNLKSPAVIGYPSKQIGLYTKPTVIFRSDSNAEDLKGFAGAGLYDSVTVVKADEVVLDYSNDRMVVDKAFQNLIFSKIGESGKIIEGLYGCAQDIEGVVKNGEIYVVQSRPQI